MNYRIRIITGYNGEGFTVSAEEAHKAYYAFTNPNVRVVFNDGGIAIRGQDIMRIEPDYHSAMGWNQGYKLTPEDWQLIRSSGTEKKMKETLELANSLSHNTQNLQLPLSELKLLK